MSIAVKAVLPAHVSGVIYPYLIAPEHVPEISIVSYSLPAFVSKKQSRIEPPIHGTPSVPILKVISIVYVIYTSYYFTVGWGISVSQIWFYSEMKLRPRCLI